MVRCEYLLVLLCISVCLTVASASLPLASDASVDINLVRRRREKATPKPAATFGIINDPEKGKKSFSERAEHRAGPVLSSNLVTSFFSNSKGCPFHDFTRPSEFDKGAALLLSLSKARNNREQNYKKIRPLETTSSHFATTKKRRINEEEATSRKKDQTRTDSVSSSSSAQTKGIDDSVEESSDEEVTSKRHEKPLLPGLIKKRGFPDLNEPALEQEWSSGRPSKAPLASEKSMHSSPDRLAWEQRERATTTSPQLAGGRFFDLNRPVPSTSTVAVPVGPQEAGKHVTSASADPRAVHSFDLNKLFDDGKGSSETNRGQPSTRKASDSHIPPSPMHSFDLNELFEDKGESSEQSREHGAMPLPSAKGKKKLGETDEVASFHHSRGSRSSSPALPTTSAADREPDIWNWNHDGKRTRTRSKRLKSSRFTTGSPDIASSSRRKEAFEDSPPPSPYASPSSSSSAPSSPSWNSESRFPSPERNFTKGSAPSTPSPQRDGRRAKIAQGVESPLNSNRFGRATLEELEEGPSLEELNGLNLMKTEDKTSWWLRYGIKHHPKLFISRAAKEWLGEQGIKDFRRIARTHHVFEGRGRMLDLNRPVGVFKYVRNPEATQKQKDTDERHRKRMRINSKVNNLEKGRERIGWTQHNMDDLLDDGGAGLTDKTKLDYLQRLARLGYVRPEFVTSLKGDWRPKEGVKQARAKQTRAEQARTKQAKPLSKEARLLPPQFERLKPWPKRPRTRREPATKQPGLGDR